MLNLFLFFIDYDEVLNVFQHTLSLMSHNRGRVGGCFQRRKKILKHI